MADISWVVQVVRLLQHPIDQLAESRGIGGRSIQFDRRGRDVFRGHSPRQHGAFSVDDAAEMVRQFGREEIGRFAPEVHIVGLTNERRGRGKGRIRHGTCLARENGRCFMLRPMRSRRRRLTPPTRGPDFTPSDTPRQEPPFGAVFPYFVYFSVWKL